MALSTTWTIFCLLAHWIRFYVRFYSVLEFSLPQGKLALFANSCLYSPVLLKEMQSLLGLLAFACKVMPAGHIFSRRLYLSTAGYKFPFSHLCLTADLKEDLLVWANFLEVYNGRSFFQADFIPVQDLVIYGCGWFYGFCSDMVVALVLWNLAGDLDSEEGYQEYRALRAVPFGGGARALGCTIRRIL